ncbi:MAG: DegT/DnrJ/EryC1/StrS aminotransferase family protein [Candidatus Omnitrophica bacterium]|nr:DegT/DnrJ/EryC1/StrS aminotransferase family protein [Candidatus Omnitrophota bacterium]
MSFWREIPPTAGLPVSIRDIAAFFSKERDGGSLERDFTSFLDVAYTRVTCSGTAGLYFIAETLKALSPKRTVIIPAFTCPLVPLAIARAGLKVQVCDIRKDNFDIDATELERLCRENNDILAVVVNHLGGLPSDMEAIAGIVQNRGILIVEDCAQSLGAEYKGRKVGTFGDFAFFSMAAGKGLTMYEGGVVTAKLSNHARLLDQNIDALERKDPWEEAKRITGLCGYAVFYRPSLFWFVYRLPEIFWQWAGHKMKALSEDFASDFPIQKVSLFRKFIGHRNFHTLESAIGSQRQKAEVYKKALQRYPGIIVVQEAPGARATYPYVAVIVDAADPVAMQPLEEMGIGLSRSFSRAVPDYEDLKGVVLPGACPNARFMAAHLWTFSTSQFMRPDDIQKVSDRVTKRC